MFTVYKKKSSLRCSTCREPKLSDIHNPKPITKNEHCINRRLSSTRSTTSSTIAVSQFAEAEAYVKASTRVRAGGRIGGRVASVAVEKESDDPHMDFLHSMLEMILENEIYSRDGLVQLLSCFLQLNSPYHHRSIVKAFTEISNGVYNSSTIPS